MLFNSIEFAVFLPIVFLLYWFVFNKNPRLQNAFLIAASYFFYGWWDWRFLALIACSSLVDYSIGIALCRTNSKGKRKLLLLTSICVNLGILAFFKYFNFFASNFERAFTFFGQSISDPILLNVLIPIGISFYTFQTLSYTIDVYKRKVESTKDILAFFAFVCFFPQLVAGPIERATTLLPQFDQPRTFNYDQATDGARQILWGLFKKIVIADNCAVYVDSIFHNYAGYSASTLLLGVTLFAFQIYADFSGYSDIAIGTARLFGFRLMRNFAFPYFSRDIAEFWRRWHISLSSWFRDYVYIPLGGSGGGTVSKIRNIFVIFIISGFWHGANWTFIVWGALNAVCFLPLMLLDKNRNNIGTVAAGRVLPNLRELSQILMTFLLTLLLWVFFRAESISHAVSYLAGIFQPSILSYPEVGSPKLVGVIALLVIAEWFQREKQHALQLHGAIWTKPVRWAAYYGIVVLVIAFGGRQQEFIYFQF